MAQQKWICRKCKKELPSMTRLTEHIYVVHNMGLAEGQK